VVDIAIVGDEGSYRRDAELGVPPLRDLVCFAPPGCAPLANTLLPLPSGYRHGDLLVTVGHCPTEVATVRLKDVARVVDAELAEPLVVLSLVFVHRSLPSVLAPHH
jgi:hypothetical protein